MILPAPVGGALPAAAGPRRGPPVRDHPPPRTRRQAMVDRSLDDVPGLGEVRRKACCSTSARSRSCGGRRRGTSPRCPESARRSAAAIGRRCTAAPEASTPPLAASYDAATDDGHLTGARPGRGSRRPRTRRRTDRRRWSSSPACPAPAGARPRRSWRTSASTSSTTSPRAVAGGGRLVVDRPGVGGADRRRLDVRSRDRSSTSSRLRRTERRRRPVPVLFLEADDAPWCAGRRRSRRPLPLQGDGRLLDGIARERVMSDRSQRPTWSSTPPSLNVHQLTGVTLASTGGRTPTLRVKIMSFGFKYGLPVDADLVADVRFLPNPYWVPELRPQTGQTPQCGTTCWGQPGASQFLEQYVALIEPRLRLPARGQALRDRRDRLHRRQTPPVAMAEALGRRLREPGSSGA